jgi:PIN domain
MKALDTGVLVGILEGHAVARELLRRLRGVEVATTEVSMLELTLRARRGPVRGHAARLASVERLRRKLTVLPIGSQAVAEATRRGSAGLHGEELLRLVEWGALEANGCDELFTREGSLVRGKWRFKVSRLGRK